VDAILSGSIPYTVATSFHAGPAHTRPHKSQKTYTQLLQDLEDERYTTDEDGEDEPGSPEEWMRRDSTWKVRPKRGERSERSERGDRSGVQRAGAEDTGGPIADEETGLLTGLEREERRDRIAQIALYGTS
jgi:hypothetical protein